MNDPNKVINVNLSSLLSLKAELLRKQTEVNKAKITQINATEYATNKGSRPLSSTANESASHRKRNKGKDSKEVGQSDDATVYEHEDSALLEKSQRVLEAKSKFYERMSRTGGQLNSDDNCLVMFNRKRQEEREEEEGKDKYNNGQGRQSPESSESDSNNSDDDDDGATTDSEEEWVEYTDCLGRTRKCLRKDLADAKRRDEELAASMPERLDPSKANWMLDERRTSDVPFSSPTTESIFSDGASFMSKHEEQRANWERKEQENLEKTDVHYQDVFFDEARQHGVGYYAFSTDEEERKRQQRELKQARQQTLSEQERREALRAQREKIIAERVLAAKNRQRARLGLPPLEEEVQAAKSSEEGVLQESKEERRARKREEKLKRKLEQKEKERELERQQHVRPWDKEKPGVTSKQSEEEWIYKPDRLPMSQEEWNEKKRAERITEFAPVPEMPIKRTNFTAMPPPAVPLIHPPHLYNTEPPAEIIPETFVNYQSTKRSNPFKSRSYEAAYDEEVSTSVGQPNRGVAIPPPDNLDDNYHIHSNAKRPKSSQELERSIEAGLRFLRNNCDKQFSSTKSSWTAKADY